MTQVMNIVYLLKNNCMEQKQIMHIIQCSCCGKLVGGLIDVIPEIVIICDHCYRLGNYRELVNQNEALVCNESLKTCIQIGQN